MAPALLEQVQSALTRHTHGRASARQWHEADSTTITKVMPGGTSPPTCINVDESG